MTTIVAPGRRAMRLRARTAEALFVLPALAYIVAFFGYPIVKNLMMSLQQYTMKSFYTGEAPFVGLVNYAKVTGARVFQQEVWNTFLFTFGSIVGQFTLGLAIAVFFAKRFFLSGFLRSLLLMPWLLPLIVSSAVWRWILDKDSGVLNTVLHGLGLVESGVPWLTSPKVALIAVMMVNIWIGIPFNAVILYGGLQDIPADLYEAAALDGATGWRAFWHVTWPMLRAVVMVVLVLSVVYTLKVLDIILGLTDGGPANASQTLATQAYKTSFESFRFGEGAALANILIGISLIFAVVYLRVSRKSVQD